MSYPYDIITDSTANLSEEMIERYGIHVLSLSFFVDEKEYFGYEKGRTVDLASFYQMMREKKHVTTSLANSEKARQMAEGLLKEGKDVLYIGFSSGLSGTYQAVSNVLEDLKEDYPERKILHVDSLAAALGEGLLVLHAIWQRESGKSIEDVFQWQVDNRLRLCHWFTVDDLFFLKRGGRLSAAQAFFGTALSIKPVLHVDNEGHLIPMEKCRGRKKSLDALVRHLADTILEPEGQTVCISHGDCEEDANYVAKKIQEDFPVKEVIIRVLDPVIGAHSGPGTVALFFLGTER